MRILIALDESPVSARAAREAVRLFSDMSTEFLVISVTRVPTMWAPGAVFGMVAPLVVDPTWMKSDQKLEVELVARAEATGVTDPEPHTASGDPVTIICQAAEDHDVDVIVVGSHDKSAWRRLVDPSVATGVVRQTYRPVLVVSGEPSE